MSDKIVIIKDGRVFAWFDKGDMFTDGSVSELRSINEVMNESQRLSQTEFQHRCDVKVSISEPEVGQKFIKVSSSSNVMKRGEKNVAQSVDITLFDDKRELREHSGICFYWARKGLKKVPMTFQQTEHRPVVVLSTLPADEHSRLTKIANTKTPAQAIKFFLRQQANNCEKQGALIHAENIRQTEFIRELWFTEGQVHILEYNVSEEGLLNGSPLSEKKHLQRAFG